MLIRIQTNAGIWRVEIPDGSASATKVSDILSQIATSRPHVVYETPVCFDPACQRAISTQATLLAQGIAHGSMLYCRVDASTCANVLAPSPAAGSDGSPSAAPTRDANTMAPAHGQHTKRIIAADGSIQLVHVHDSSLTEEDKGFRKGMLPLRDMKMQWTLRDFMDMDSRFVYKIKRQEERWIGTGGVSLDTANAQEFQTYLRKFNFQRARMGFLYGKFIDDADAKKKVSVEAIYEPRQEVDTDGSQGFVLLDDDDDDQEDTAQQPCHDRNADTIASYLGLQKVGWIFGHKPREHGFHMSAAEIIMAAEFQLEAADGVHPTPFVTVKVTLGDDGQTTSFEAFQVSLQAMEMVAEGALEIYDPDPKLCLVNETFTAIKEGKESKTIEAEFFLTVVPIVQHESDVFVCQFPKLNRDFDDRHPSHTEMKKQLSKSGSAGWSFIDLIADFNLLVYLCDYLDVKADMSKICASIVDRNIPLDEGFKLIIGALAGLDNAY
jgi:nuclear protein localization family protein 4